MEEIMEHFEGYGLTRSEKMALKALVNRCGADPDNIERQPDGVDFIYDSYLGIEVKGKRHWNISRLQLEEILDLEKAVILTTGPDNVSFDVVVDGEGWSEDVEDLWSVFEEIGDGVRGDE